MCVQVSVYEVEGEGEDVSECASVSVSVWEGGGESDNADSPTRVFTYLAL